MAKSVLFQRVQQLLQTAHWLNRHPATSFEELQERRAFLKQLALASTALIPTLGLLEACSHPAPRSMASGGPTDLTRPVAVLGAGIAGLTAALHLSRSGIACEIFEASRRVGGRMFTRENFNEQAMTCELGGELVDSNHDDLIGLCRAFNIPVDSFAAGDQGLAPNLYYFAGRLHTDQDVIAHFRAVSRALARDAQACAVPENQADDPYYFTAAAKHLDHTSLEHYLGRIQGIEKWVIDMIRVAYVGEFGLEASEQSALGLVLTLSPDTTQGFKLFGESDQSQRIRGGNIALIRALEADLNRRGVPIHLEHPLVSIREMSSRLELVFGGNTPSRTMSADEVVCTIPFTLLREVEGIKTLPISELKRECIRELGYGTNSKRMLGFTERSWRHGFQSPTHRIPSSNGSVYTDLSVQNLWETSRTQTGRSGILTVFLGGQSGANLNVSHPNAHLVEIDRIFPGTRRLHDSHHAALNWSHFPWTQGSYACARLGQTTRFGGIAYQPELAGRLLFAGEHATAQFSGFMNGACSSGRVAAQTIISRRHSAAA